MVHDVYLKKYILGGITDKEKAQELLTMTQAGGDSGNDKQTADSTRIWPYGFTLLHLLAIQSPAVLGNMDLDYSKYKAPYLFDSFDKTPLHYLLEDYSKRKFNKAINKLVNYTLDWVEDDTLFPFSQRMKVLESLSSLLIHPKIKILSRLESSIAVRLLESFIQIPESKENRIDPTFYGVLADEIVICPTLRPYLNDSDRYNFLKKEKKKANKHKTLQENEDNFDQKNSTIRVSVGFLKLNYGLNSSDMKNFVTTFQGINDQAFFETKIVSVIIARLWNFHKYYHFALCIIYSVMMILYSVMVATGIDLSGGVVERNLGLDIAIIVLDAVLLVNEIFIQFRDDSKGYFKDVWNFIEFIYYWLLLSAMIYHLQASSMDDLVLAWLFGMSLFLGYLRWLSYFRLFEISSNNLRFL